MGLNVTGFHEVERTGATIDDFVAGQVNHHDHVYLVQEAGYSDRSDGIADGIYRIGGKRFDISVGSYACHDTFRAGLAALVGRSQEQVWNDTTGQARKLPFYELIDFSDCTGFLGPRTSRKLVLDFSDMRGEAVKYARKTSNLEWLNNYGLYHRACLLAAACGRGVVLFH